MDWFWIGFKCPGHLLCWDILWTTILNGIRVCRKIALPNLDGRSSLSTSPMCHKLVASKPFSDTPHVISVPTGGLSSPTGWLCESVASFSPYRRCETSDAGTARFWWYRMIPYKILEIRWISWHSRISRWYVKFKLNRNPVLDLFTFGVSDLGGILGSWGMGLFVTQICLFPK